VGKKATPPDCHDVMASVFAALGSSTRLAILVRLNEWPARVGEVAAAVGPSKPTPPSNSTSSNRPVW
jgi:DNA-binding transcriptional ArsR family regulator